MRGVELVGWLGVAVAGVVMLSQAFGWAGFRTMAVVQSLTPYLALAMAPVAIIALAGQHVWIALSAAVIGIGGMVLAWPILFVAERPPVAADTVGTRIAAVNLLFTNGRIEELADDLGRRNIDVIVFSEYTPEHQAVLQSSELADAFEFRVDRSGQGGRGTAVWTRSPVGIDEHPDTGNHSLDLTISTKDGPIRLIAVHPPTPIHDFDAWLRDLDTAGDLGRRGDIPTVIVGDFNASFWHPAFRALLDDGYTDAHIANGRGLSVSWPTNRTFPPFVRLDHALTTDRLVATDVEDFDVPGSDHRGFVVTVAPAR
jgi:endonuclease/exonuclease/phosphatase (EEP) superfamily protein YafD